MRPTQLRQDETRALLRAVELFATRQPGIIIASPRQVKDWVRLASEVITDHPIGRRDGFLRFLGDVVPTPDGIPILLLRGVHVGPAERPGGPFIVQCWDHFCGGALCVHFAIKGGRVPRQVLIRADKPEFDQFARGQFRTVFLGTGKPKGFVIDYTADQTLFRDGLCDRVAGRCAQPTSMISGISWPGRLRPSLPGFAPAAPASPATLRTDREPVGIQAGVNSHYTLCSGVGA